MTTDKGIEAAARGRLAERENMGRDPFDIVADWHDKQAATFKAMSTDIRAGELGRAKAAEASKHHAGSAAALRLSRMNRQRAAITKDHGNGN